MGVEKIHICDIQPFLRVCRVPASAPMSLYFSWKTHPHQDVLISQLCAFSYVVVFFDFYTTQ